MKTTTKIYSIFGQIEAVAAETLIEQGRATKVAASSIPPTARFNHWRQPALFAVIIPERHVAEFEQLIRDLRA